MDPEVLEECVGGMAHMVWVTVVWVLLAFVGIVVDEQKADNGTEAEREHLTTGK